MIKSHSQRLFFIASSMARSIASFMASLSASSMANAVANGFINSRLAAFAGTNIATTMAAARHLAKRTSYVAALCLLLPAISLALPKNSPVPGGVVVVKLSSDDAPRPTVRFQERRVAIVRHRGFWHAVVGIPLETKAGMHALRVDGQIIDIDIANKTYPERRLTVTNDRTATPTAADEAVIAGEQPKLEAAKRLWIDREPENWRLKLPVRGAITSSFGKISYYNDNPTARRHTGIDVGGATGRTIRSAGAGIVTEADNFFITGGSVFINHGQGLITFYCHMSRIDVKPGDVVETGDVIGAVGASGRVTGPHLHWSVLLNGHWVDPVLFLAKQGK